MFDDDLYLCPAKTSMFDDDLYVRPRPLCYRRRRRSAVTLLYTNTIRCILKTVLSNFQTRTYKIKTEKNWAETSMNDDDFYVRPRPLYSTTTSMSGHGLYVRRRPLCPAKTSMYGHDLYVRPRPLCAATTTSMFDDGLSFRIIEPDPP